MDLQIHGKVALVMASSKGLGKAVAIELAREGAHVVICGRDEEALTKLKNEIEACAEGRILAVPCDLKIEEQRKLLIDATMKAFGRIDILVTNMGGPAAGKFEAFGLKEWRDIYEQIFISVVDVIGQTIPIMKSNGWGRILVISSVSVKQPIDGLVSSNAVRTSMLGLVKSLSNELAPYDITVNNIMPGFTQTSRIEELIAKDPKASEVVNIIPAGRYGKVEEFAAAAAFLVSGRASYITGQSIAVDGGFTKGS